MEIRINSKNVESVKVIVLFSELQAAQNCKVRIGNPES